MVKKKIPSRFSIFSRIYSKLSGLRFFSRPGIFASRSRPVFWLRLSNFCGVSGRLLGKFLLFPVRLFSFVFRHRISPPLVVSYKDMVPFAAKVRAENSRYKVYMLIFLTLALGSLFCGKFLPFARGGIGGSYIAKIVVDEELGEQFVSPDFMKKVIDRVENDKRAVAVLVEVNSPGGTVYHSHKLYRAIRKIGETKPTIAIATGVAASGGYMVATACDKILALESSLIGSVGVIYALPNYKKLLDKVGVKYLVYKSSPLKAAPNSFEEVTEEVARSKRENISSVMKLFTSIVKDRRNMSASQLSLVSDASVYYGTEAVNRKLIDAIGDEKQAIEILVSNGVVTPKTKVVNVTIKQKKPASYASAKSALLRPLFAIASHFGFKDVDGLDPAQQTGVLLKYQP